MPGFKRKLLMTDFKLKVVLRAEKIDSKAATPEFDIGELSVRE